MIVFGPVPSRRLGISLGINNIPPKICDYSCIYCQIRCSTQMQSTRSFFYPLSDILQEIELKMREIHFQGTKIDYITFVADGEPTLDRRIGEEINCLKKFGIKIAVITNASLLSQPELRDEISAADWVSVKIDAISDNIWKNINHPLRNLKIEEILQGIQSFSSDYHGFLATETMIVKGINDSLEEIEKIANFIMQIHPRKSYLSIPTRPPLISSVFPPDEDDLNKYYYIFCEKGIPVEYLIGYEGNEFVSTGNPETDLLNILAVHPMKQEAVQKMFENYHTSFNLIEKMIEQNQIIKLYYRDEIYYVRNLAQIRTRLKKAD